MLSTLLMMMLAMAAVAFWYAGRGAAETATRVGQAACSRAGVQWLDQSVHLLTMRLSRGGDGWVALERHFAFEYSTDGDDRRSGRIVLHGRRLRSVVGPMPLESVAQP